MPMYEFQCSACHAKFEELIRSPNDASSICCPKCGDRKVERKLSVFAARAGPGHPASATEGGRHGGACGRCGDPNGPCSQ